MPPKDPNRYSLLLAALFAKHYSEEMKEISFERAELSQAAR
jgi:hypothetical protein